MKRGGFLKRRTALRKVSRKRQREGAVYRKKRHHFLTEFPLCEIEREGCHKYASDIHHKAGRLQGNYLNQDTWIPAWRHCHDWIHRNPIEARELRLLV